MSAACKIGYVNKPTEAPSDAAFLGCSVFELSHSAGFAESGDAGVFGTQASWAWAGTCDCTKSGGFFNIDFRQPDTELP
jgi:hypothetical protein